MPASSTSLRLTDSYRAGLTRVRSQAERLADGAWAAVDTEDLAGTFPAWVSAVAPVVGTIQQSAVAITATWLGAFASAELDRPHDVEIDLERYADEDAFGRPLQEAFGTPILTALSAIGEGKPLAEAMDMARTRATRLAGEAVVEAARLAQFDAMANDPTFTGWIRVPRGTCGACLADTRSYVRDVGEPMRRHPNCLCVAEPGVAGVVDRNPRPSGQQLLAQMSEDAKVAQFGPAKAEALRMGEIVLDDLSHEQEMELGGAVLTEATLEQATR